MHLEAYNNCHESTHPSAKFSMSRVSLMTCWDSIWVTAWAACWYWSALPWSLPRETVRSWTLNKRMSNPRNVQKCAWHLIRSAHLFIDLWNCKPYMGQKQVNFETKQQFKTKFKCCFRFLAWFRSIHLYYRLDFMSFFLLYICSSFFLHFSQCSTLIPDRSRVFAVTTLIGWWGCFHNCKCNCTSSSNSWMTQVWSQPSFPNDDGFSYIHSYIPFVPV